MTGTLTKVRPGELITKENAAGAKRRIHVDIQAPLQPPQRWYALNFASVEAALTYLNENPIQSPTRLARRARLRPFAATSRQCGQRSLRCMSRRPQPRSPTRAKSARTTSAISTHDGFGPVGGARQQMRASTQLATAARLRTGAPWVCGIASA